MVNSYFQVFIFNHHETNIVINVWSGTLPAIALFISIIYILKYPSENKLMIYINVIWSIILILWKLII